MSIASAKFAFRNSHLEKVELITIIALSMDLPTLKFFGYNILGLGKLLQSKNVEQLHTSDDDFALYRAPKTKDVSFSIISVSPLKGFPDESGKKIYWDRARRNTLILTLHNEVGIYRTTDEFMDLLTQETRKFNLSGESRPRQT